MIQAVAYFAIVAPSLAFANNPIQSCDNLTARDWSNERILNIFLSKLEIIMNKLIYYGAIAMLSLLASASASAAATVSYVNPDKMTDVPRDKSDRQWMETTLLEHFNKLAAKLPAGQDLKVEILDIDLAGEVFPRVPVQNVRVYKDRNDRVQIHLRFSIEQDGKVVRSGERQLTDAGYLMDRNHYTTNEIYSYEKQLLDDWFRKEVIAAR
jgi:hypothetical protein